MTRLKLLSDFLHAGDDHYFMFELLVPAETAEDKAAGERFDVDVRPRLMVEAIRQLQDFGVEPDIWKIEGLDRQEDAEAVAAQARSGRTRGGRSRERVGSILLGRGSDQAQVYHWLKVAAPLPGYIGFAVGRTNFGAPLKRYIADPASEAEAVQAIADNYKGCVDTWLQARTR
jgi:5-dehydro-2-deoxygluconokinase